MSIFVLYNGQKKTIKVSPNTLMQQVLQEATSAFKIDNNNTNNFVLKHKKTVINNSEPFRFANIPNNATLDLDIIDKSNSNSNKINTGISLTKIALSIEGAGSITGTYDSSLTLLQMIESLVNEGKLSSNIISSSIELIYLRTSYKGQDELSKITFLSLGLAGQSVRLQLRSNLLTNASSSSSSSSSSSTTTTTTTTTTTMESSIQIDNNENSNLKESSNIDNIQTISSNAPMEVEKNDNNINNGDNIDDINGVINSMLSQNFDQVSSPAIITILKYIYNIIKYPDDSKYRLISTGNKAYIEKISNAKGISDVLKVIGFSSVENSNPLSYILNGSSSKIIPLLEQAEIHLIEAMNKLQVPEDDRPKKHAAISNKNQCIPIDAFDPFKTAVIRNTPQPYRVESEVDKKLAFINKRRLELEGDPDSVERLTEVSIPDVGGNFKQVDEDIDTGEKSDSKIVARSIMNALKKSNDEAPLTTKAIRDLEKAQNEKVYSKTLIRIKFSDRVCLLGYFHPRHTTIDIYEWIYSCLVFENVDMKSKLFELYISPPRIVLPLDKSLFDLQLVPAALIHVSWMKNGQEALSKLSSSTIGSYLKESLLSKSAEKHEHSISIPSGEQLVSSFKETLMTSDNVKDEMIIDSNADSKDSNKEDSKMKKPKWLNSLLK